MIYNAYTDMFVLLRSKIIVDNHNIISADTINPEFYENAIKSGCIIENKVDEIDNVRNEIIRANENDEFFHLTINPNIVLNVLGKNKNRK